MTTKVLALWSDPDSSNFGVRALATGLELCLPPSCEVDHVSHNRPLAGVRLSHKRIAQSLLLPSSPLGRALRQYDLVIDVGEGDSFTTIYGWKRFSQFAGSKLAVIRAGVPLVLSPQTLGPWSPVARPIALAAMRASAGVWARDSESLERGRQATEASAIGLATDLVFALPRSGSRAAKDRVVVNVSGLLWEPNPHVDFRMYRNLTNMLLATLAEAKKEVVLLPHVLAPGSPDDDVEVSRQLATTMGLQVAFPESLGQLRATIAGASLLIGARMHACLNALSQGVAVIPLAYSAKFASLFADLNYPNVVDLREVDAIPRVRRLLAEQVALSEAAAFSATEGTRRLASFRDELANLSQGRSK